MAFLLPYPYGLAEENYLPIGIALQE